MRIPAYGLAVSLVFFVSISAFAQTQLGLNGSITGRVTERSTGQPIAGCRVSVIGVADTTTDDDGIFRLELPPGVYDVEISAKGFAPLVRNQVGVTGGRSVRLDVQLLVTLSEIIDVKSSVFAENAEQAVSSIALDREALRQTPGSGGDPLRAINSLPAVSAASAEFADLIVRGGTTDENLVFVDRIPVDDFTYFTDKYDSGRGGRASILAPDVFETVEFSAGGFGARYGDRMSSALDISLREAARERVQGVFFVDSGTAGGSIDVPLGKRGSWLFSARRSYIDVALDVAGIADQNIIGYPATYDFINKVVYDLTPRHKLSFTAMNFLEFFEQSDDQAFNVDRRTDRFRMRRTSRRLATGATLSSTLGEKTLAQTTVWATGAHNDGSFYLPGSTFLQRARDLRDSRVGIKEDVNYAFDRRFELVFGGGLYFDQANYRTFENTGAFYSPLEEEFNAPPRDNRLELGTKASAYGYVQGTFRVSNIFSVTPGLRVDRYGLTGETLASPRLGARFNARSNLAVTFAAGVYRQPPSVFVLSLTPINRDLKTQTATHLIGGVEWLIDENTRFRAEAFRKTYRDLAIHPVRLTQTSFADGNYFNAGRGNASGFELSVQRALTGFFSGQASYSFLRSRRSFDAGSPLVPSDFERPHQLVLIGITRFYGFTVAAKYRLASGLPYTLRTPIEIFPGSFAYLQRIASLNDINAGRLPNFASLDLRAEKRFAFRRWSLAPYIDYFNITNHDSIVQTNYEFFRPTPQFLRENRRFPLFGLKVEF